jgi:hypothetical protein
MIKTTYIGVLDATNDLTAGWAVLAKSRRLLVLI